MYPGAHAAQAPDRPAAIMHETGERLSYADLEERSVRLSRLLHDAGLRPGDGIALIAENDLRYFEAYWAVLRSGLYFTAVNWHLTAAERGYIVNDSVARAVIVSASRAGLARDTPGVDVRLAFGGAVPGYDDYERALAAIEQHRITHSQWVPTHFVRMLKLPEQVRASFDHSSLVVAIHAAAPCPVHVKQAMIDWWGPVVHEYHAATEGADDGTELRSGEVGTVYFEREQLPFRYHNDDARTAQAQHPAHPFWTTTGDVGYLDEEGYLFLTDRKSFMIISGGVNIYSQEVENCLSAHPDVLDVAVIGVPDEEMGESVLAVVQPVPGIAAGAELERRLIDFARNGMAHYKAPRRVSFTDELPRTPTGKLRKHLLREKYAG